MNRMVRAMMAPLRGSRGRLQLLLALGAIAWFVIFKINLHVLSFAALIPDGNSYTNIANGNSHLVMQPFVSRQLGAQMAGAVGRLMHWAVEPAFFVQAIVSVLFTLGIVFAIGMKTLTPRWMIAAIVVAPFWGPLVQFFTLPDAWYSAVLAVLLVLLLLDRLGAAALMMFPLMLSRESTSLTLVCFLIAAWASLRWRDRILAVLSAVAGSWVVGRLAVGSLANREKIPQSVYLLLKAPWNFMRNIVGLQPWSDANPDLCKVPRWSMPLHLGPVHAIGVCGYSAGGLHLLVLAVLYNFGLLPVLVGFLWWRHRRWAGRSVLLRFTLLYGAASFLLAPLLGTWMLHLVSYGWPLFCVAAPLLFDEFDAPIEGIRAWAGLGFFALHLLVCGLSSWFLTPWYLPLQIVLWGAGFVLLRYWIGNADVAPLIYSNSRFPRE